MCRESLSPLPFLKTLPISMLPEVVVDFQYGTSLVSRYWYTAGCSKLPFCRLFSAETVATSEAAETSVPSAESTPTRGIRGIPNPRIRAQVITSASTLRWDFPACMSSPPWEPGGDVIVDIEHHATKTVPRQWVHIRGGEIIDNLSDYSAKSRVLSNNPERKCNRKRRYERNHQHECERAATQATRNARRPATASSNRVP